MTTAFLHYYSTRQTDNVRLGTCAIHICNQYFKSGFQFLKSNFFCKMSRNDLLMHLNLPGDISSEGKPTFFATS